MVFDSVVPKAFGMDSQQTLNCALSVDHLWNQGFRSDKPCGNGPGSSISATAAGNESQIFKLSVLSQEPSRF